MTNICVCLLLLTVVSVIGSDWRAERKYENSVDSYILRKGGVSRRTKLLNTQFIIGKIYIAPQMREKIKIAKTFDLVSYTICEKMKNEVFTNLSTRIYNYIACPDEEPSSLHMNTIKEYCCARNSIHCCNSTEFMMTLPIRPEVTFSFRSLFSIIGFFIFVIVALGFLKIICGPRIRSRWSTMQIFRQRGPPPCANNYQQNIPLMYPPNPQMDKQNPYPQYAANPYGNPGMASPSQYTPGQPMIGQYNYGPLPTTSQPMATPYQYGPTQASGQQLQNQNPTQDSSQAPPPYEKAITQ